jgi:GH15 family glucan-1,4-alpha-glucosidase
MTSTVEAIKKRLMRDGCFVRRYDEYEAEDSFPPGEDVFLPCSFWLVDNFVLQGRYDEGRGLFEQLLDVRNDVGLLKQFDVDSKRLLGNFPQALSHLSLVNTAYNLHEMHGPARRRQKHEREY